MPSFLSHLTWRPLAVALAAGALALGGVAYAATHSPPAPAAQQAMATPAAPERAAGGPSSAPSPAPSTSPTPFGPPRPGPIVGQVTAISPNPQTFTIQTPDGRTLTYRVLEATVFAAGRDRPYNFGLLKVGDEVRVRGGGRRAGADQPGAGRPAAGQAKGARLRPRAGEAARAAGLPAARVVMVRPAGDQQGGADGLAVGRAGRNKKGGSGGAGQ